MMKSSVLSVVLCLLAFTSCGCSQKGEPVVPEPSGDFVRMTDDILVPTQLLPISVPISVLLPKSYQKEPDKRYPVVY
ncbi:MAG: hypothetical protein J6P56_05145, partial [Bacteroidales bacterium]|nr:hypothetical protein [Bacteroidales bacterium]